MTPPTPPQERFLDESVLADFTAMRMTAFGKSVIDIANDPAFDTWTFSQKVLYALDKEVAARRERRINKLLKASRSPNPDACLEDVVYAPDRNINPEQVSRLAHGQWCHLGQNIVILGKSSVGKTYLAQALITAACRNDYSARFYRTDMLAAHFAVMPLDDPARLKLTRELINVDVLVLDDFLTTPVDAATAHLLFNILSERESNRSTIVTSQFTPQDWYRSIPDAVIAESILNRLIAGAEIITLEGPNMRLEANQ
ncbi:ATP-binding protein [Corynebacterium sp. zg-913]|uniref:ATP-binding protein n=2 Tax=Corynebacterium wankanglinii TaxID=2735136 RepID=A0A7H0KAM1_9CORY|nr:ATP-binding protein [Corynebacterium wankanglinii]MBA1836633.1 ATP-binding protein [Corynebacterium wankanglinii]QNP93900.1 ATP-binding protein [Corynebacterium wankanglinii]QNP94054.1 ATP-binding protein [Corynebacterium wankanglinii]QNP94056.1 ATP-binding protein [Corynebacterium wankanglinii]QNP94337.1 ATP-binding protein [Corynebacterium wankanglinii]